MREIQQIRIKHTSIFLEVMVHEFELNQMRPLVILNSLDFPMPPSINFCQQAKKAGFQVIFVRRPGYGSSPALPLPLLRNGSTENNTAVITEAAILMALFKTMRLNNLVLMGLGSANPVCYRLALLDESINLSVFANPVFNQDIFEVFRPDWLQSMLREIVVSKGGLNLAAIALKATLKRNPIWFYQQFVQKSVGDLEYVSQNTADFRRSGLVLQSIDPKTLLYDVRASLVRDSFLKDGIFNNINAIVLTGDETRDRWKSGLDYETRRLGLQSAYAPRGDAFVPYASPETLFEVIQKKT